MAGMNNRETQNTILQAAPYDLSSLVAQALSTMAAAAVSAARKNKKCMPVHPWSWNSAGLETGIGVSNVTVDGIN